MPQITIADLKEGVLGKYQIFGWKLFLLSTKQTDAFTALLGGIGPDPSDADAHLLDFLSGSTGMGFAPLFADRILRVVKKKGLNSNSDCLTALIAAGAAFNAAVESCFKEIHTEYVGDECKGEQARAVNGLFVSAESAALAAKLDAYGL